MPGQQPQHPGMSVGMSVSMQQQLSSVASRGPMMVSRMPLGPPGGMSGPPGGMTMPQQIPGGGMQQQMVISGMLSK